MCVEAYVRGDIGVLRSMFILRMSVDVDNG